MIFNLLPFLVTLLPSLIVEYSHSISSNLSVLLYKGTRLSLIVNWQFPFRGNHCLTTIYFWPDTIFFVVRIKTPNLLSKNKFQSPQERKKHLNRSGTKYFRYCNPFNKFSFYCFLIFRFRRQAGS